MGSPTPHPRGDAADAPDESRRVGGATSPAPPITVYWRPGCASCVRLRAGLSRWGIDRREFDIWRDPDAAERVRRLAGGTETVPTVVIGDRALVDPSLDDVLGVLDHPTATPRARTSGRELRRGLIVVAALLVSLALEAAGHPGLSWAFDGAAVTVVAVARTRRRRRRRAR